MARQIFYSCPDCDWRKDVVLGNIAHQRAGGPAMVCSRCRDLKQVGEGKKKGNCPDCKSSLDPWDKKTCPRCGESHVEAKTVAVIG